MIEQAAAGNLPLEVIRADSDQDGWRTLVCGGVDQGGSGSSNRRRGTAYPTYKPSQPHYKRRC
jgi:hypothetical protein